MNKNKTNKQIKQSQARILRFLFGGCQMFWSFTDPVSLALGKCLPPCFRSAIPPSLIQGSLRGLSPKSGISGGLGLLEAARGRDI